MKTKTVHFSRKDNGSFYVACDVEVEGIGELKLSDCLSTETMNAVCKEVEEATRLKLQGRVKEP